MFCWQIRKHDWTEQGSSLKAKINIKLSVYKAAAKLKVRSHVTSDLDGKLSKKLLHGALALLVEAAEACLYSVWRRLRTCEDLFNSLLDGISKIAFTRGGHLLRVLLIRFKQLVLITCAQVYIFSYQLHVCSFFSSCLFVYMRYDSLNRLRLGKVARELCLIVF